MRRWRDTRRSRLTRSYYRNEPGFLRTNLTLRLAVAPTYLDSELGIRHVLGENTDLGIGVAGGGFADSYREIRQGTYYPSESFDGYGARDLAQPLSSFQSRRDDSPERPGARYRALSRPMVATDDTASKFQLPEDRDTFSVRTGLRWGGREPTLFPALAMELSAWYEGQFPHRARAPTDMATGRSCPKAISSGPRRCSPTRCRN